MTAGDLAKLTEVSRRYFHTKAGYEATLLLGRYQLDQGRPLAAALTLKRVADSPVAAAQYDPELSVLLATCWVHANQPEKATDDARCACKQRLPQAKVRLLDGEEPLFSSDDQALAWLERIVGGGRIAAVAGRRRSGSCIRGNETRNATTHGGVPLLNFNWKLPTVNEPADEAARSRACCARCATGASRSLPRCSRWWCRTTAIVRAARKRTSCWASI